MRKGAAYSVALHAAVLVVGYYGLPHLPSPPIDLEQAMAVEVVNVSDLPSSPPPPPAPVEAKKETPTPPPPPQVRTPSPPPPAPPSPPELKPEEVAVLVRPDPKKPEPPKPEQPKAEEPKPQPVVADLKPRRKPKAPDTFASVLKTVEDLKRQTPKPPEKPEEKKVEKPKTESFESQIAKALSQPVPPTASTRPPSASEIDVIASAIRRQIEPCWNLPSGAQDAENLAIEVAVEFATDGTVRHAEVRDARRIGSDPFFRAAAESAMRALLNPRCNPFKLPPDKYDQWRAVTLVFNPRQMFGRS
ncbi:MAG: hypothetical protein EXQ90_03850 [Rhodospirillales bacterium]|nr:hypothetical protein [Rhodospirillales bacterium]